MRFRISSDESFSPELNGWWMDQFEILELENYNSQVCIQSDQTTQSCTIAGQRGTLVNTQSFITSNEDISFVEFFQVYPNPSKEGLQIQLANKPTQHIGELSIFSTSGQKMHQQKVTLNQAEQQLEVGSAGWPAGIYAVTLRTQDEVITRKWIKL